MKRQYDKRTREAYQYQPGDLVWLEGTHIRTDRPTKKLEDRRYGPFKIIKQVGASAYHLDLPKTWRGIHPVLNESVLTPYHHPEFPSQSVTKPTASTAVAVEADNTYEVEEVINSKYDARDRLQYHVKYKDKPRSEWEWIPATKLKTYAKDKIDAFHRSVPGAPRPLASIRIPPRATTTADTRRITAFDGIPPTSWLHDGEINWPLPFRPIENLTQLSDMPPRLFDWTTGNFNLSSIARTRSLRRG